MCFFYQHFIFRDASFVFQSIYQLSLHSLPNFKYLTRWKLSFQNLVTYLLVKWLWLRLWHSERCCTLLFRLQWITECHNSYNYSWSFHLRLVMVRTYVHSCICTYTYVHSCAFAYIHVHSYTLMHTNTHLCTLIYNRAYSCIPIYNRSHSSTLIYNCSHLRTLMYNRAHSCTVMRTHIRSYTIVRTHVHSCTIVHTHLHSWYVQTPTIPILTYFHNLLQPPGNSCLHH